MFNVSKNVNDINTVYQLPKCETITLKTEWGSLIKCQIDIVSGVNILPISIYETASKDYNHTEIKTSKTKHITAFGATKWNVRGERILKVQR